MMRAWRVEAHGEPRDVLRLVDVDRQAPGPGQVLVRALAVAANFPDVLLARGEYQVRPALPFVPGIELCGEVVATGDGVGHLVPGQRVVGSRIGVLAEYAVLDAALVFPAPEQLSDAEAAALYIGHQTGHFGLHRRARIQPGETLLVHAAAGGVGTAAVQLGKAAGAQVIGVVGNAAKVEVARAAGADVVVDRSAEDFVEAVGEATGGRGADVVYDPVGGDSFDRSTRCVAFEGRIVVVGFAGGVIQTMRPSHALLKNYAVLGLYWGLYAERRPDLVAATHRELTRLAAEGLVRPVVRQVVPFEQAADAIQQLADGTTVGRVVIAVA
ncbi:NADPH:quinone oxidoreductase family protein [Cellulomonas chengniuliangii]|uniref:NADPH:quinone oxidoreductase family protein n=1 Tax=Cellulomonas chengniuliangii TaxID=2968084 RepID=A0ABY5L3I7_9CELL|nr:NADPH:quinone oxidoreductase family protein [Cellulomonas chengniuliangii]MCC2309812.1 NADPH:quinone oxidoreductase family protein [Cellulomonas chengniuliangii]UUI76256.1 NADPH:quinone oxidoreductase family protein [Cellulomonas chengniuliangii]